MPSKGNPYPSRDSLSKNEAHHSPYESRGFMKDLIMGPKKIPDYTRPEAEKPKEPESIFKRRKEGLHPNEVTAEFKKMTEFHTKMDSGERLDLAKELIKKYHNTELKDVVKEERLEGKEASLGDTEAERSGARHRLEALKILEKRKEK